MSEQPLGVAAPDPISASQPPPSQINLIVRRRWFPPLFYLVLGTLFLWRSLFTGEVFLPASLLGHVAPWATSSLYQQLTPWNPLRWDGIGQFYPWRHFAAETLRTGALPLWNPYQFCGTPFVANSQSAVLYPGNLLFWLLPDTSYAFGWSALLHLTLCGWFTCLLLRTLRCSTVASLLGGVVFAYSAWQIAWLQLPTFLATSCWFPLLMREILVAANCGAEARRSEAVPLRRVDGLIAACRIGAVIGMMLLAGHLQIALYGLLAGSGLAVGLLALRRARLSAAPVWGAGLAIGMLLAAPQILPSAELSRISHRVGSPSFSGYRAYTDYALPAAGLAGVLLPNIAGGDADSSNPFWLYYRKSVAGRTVGILHNPIETAIYVGIVPLLLGLFACLRGLRPGGFDRRTALFALLAALTILLALGTPVNRALYFGIPGFAQSGSPARCLVLWALAWAGLAALGLDRLQREFATERDLAIVYGIVLLLLAVGLNFVAGALSAPPLGIRQAPGLPDLLGRIWMDWARLGVLSLVAVAILAWPILQRHRTGEGSRIAGPISSAALALVVLDLFSAGIGANPTARREQVYPKTPAIAYVQEHAGHNRIYPINHRWSLFAPANTLLPVVLPPNAATVFDLRDVQGYDSLFAGQYKSYANAFARPNRQGVKDASPPEVGNIVYFQDANAPGVPDTGAVFALSVPIDVPGFTPDAVPGSTPLDVGDPGAMVYALDGPGRVRMQPGTSMESGVSWTEDAATRVRLTVTTPVAASLVLADANLPGWRARIDGRRVPIDPARSGAAARALSVEAGSHQVDFRYEPTSFRVGLFLACVAAALLSLAGAIRSTLGRRSPLR